MKKLLLGVIFLSLLTTWWCSITLDEAKAGNVDCEAMENNLTIISNQLWKLQTENDEQKDKINELENIYKDYEILSWEIKKLNKKITELEEENKKLKDTNTELKDENTKLKEQNKEISAEKDEIEIDYSWSKSKIADYIWIIKKLREELSALKNEVKTVENTWDHWSATLIPTSNSKNKIETNYMYTPNCEYTTKVMSENNTLEDMPNKNWTDDIKFVNNILQDVQNNGENLVIKYINEANEILDSKWLTKRDQCRYSLLIDILKNQKGIVNSYKNENWKITIWINFISYKENITRDDRRPDSYWEIRDIENSPSSKTKYYTLAENPELETLNVDRNWYLHFQWNSSTIFINDRDSRINKFCNNEPIYTELLVWELAIHNTVSQYYNQNNGHYCIKDRLDTKWARFIFDFNWKWEISKIKVKYNLINQK